MKCVVCQGELGPQPIHMLQLPPLWVATYEATYEPTATVTETVLHVCSESCRKTLVWWCGLKNERETGRRIG